MSQNSEPLLKRCARFNPYYKGTPQSQNAILYVKLRKDGCDKKSALQFTTKQQCRIDATKQNDGPPKFRDLKIRPNTYKISYNGWTYQQPQYDIGQEYYGSVNEFLITDENDKKMEQNFTKHESHMKEDYKKKIQSIKHYLELLDNYCSLPNIRTNKAAYLKKLSELKNNIKNKSHFQVPVEYRTDTGQWKDTLINKFDLLMDPVMKKFEDAKYSFPISSNRQLHRKSTIKTNMNIKILTEESQSINQQLESQADSISNQQTEESGFEQEQKELADEVKKMMKNLKQENRLLQIITGQDYTRQRRTTKHKQQNSSNEEQVIQNYRPSFQIAQEFNNANYFFFEGGKSESSLPKDSEDQLKKRTTERLKQVNSTFKLKSQIAQDVANYIDMTLQPKKFNEIKEDNLNKLLKETKAKDEKPRIIRLIPKINTSTTTNSKSFSLSSRRINNI